jgi:hypothetical protein
MELAVGTHPESAAVAAAEKDQHIALREMGTRDS